MFTLKDSRLEREVFGIKFPNPVGLAAGFDKDAKLIDELVLEIEEWRGKLRLLNL